MDATAAGPNASLVGNTVDRGFGHTWYGDHFLTCCGMEVVLADGRVVRTGFGHYPNARATRVHRYGVGPMLDGLFCQSNQGIVLRIGLWLQPAPEAFEFFYFQAPNEEVLATLVDRLRPLRLDGTLRTAVYIANDFRVLAGHAGYPWEEANDQTPLPHDVRMGLNRFGLAKALAIKLDILRPNYDLLKGIPTPEPLLGQQWRLRNPPDDGPCDLLGPGCGFYWISPAMPMLGPEATELRELVEPIFAEHGFDMIVSFSLLTERSFVAIFNIAFDQSIQGEPERASKCYDALVKAMQGAGFYPYRVGLQGMEKLWSGDPEYWDVLNDIKRALDPEDIVARGRYIPPLEKEWIILAAASGSPSAPATPRGDSTRNRYSISP